MRSRLDGHQAYQDAVAKAQAILGDGHVLVEGRRVLEANEAYQRLTGYSLAELRALPSLVAVLAPEDAPRIAERYRASREVPNEERLEATLVRRDGTRVRVEIASVVADASAGLMLVVVRDVTARWNAQEAARDNAERLDLLARSALEGVAVHRAGIVDSVNPALVQMLGYEPDEMRGRLILDFVAPHDRARAGEVMRTGSEAPYEAEVLRKDGSILPVEIVARTLTLDQGVARVVTVRDISDRREKLVAKALVRRLLRDLSADGVRSEARRALGRGLVAEAGARDLDGYLRTFQALGLGELHALHVDAGAGRHEIVGRDLLERAAGANAPTCHIALGYLEGALAALSGKPALGAETACQSQGAPECRFTVRAR